MGLKAYLPQGFAHLHESRCFDALVHALEKEYSSTTETCYLIGNVFFNGSGLDAIFLKPGAICVIEMKEYGGLVHFSENGEWFAGEKIVKGVREANPFYQVRGYKFTLLDYFRQREQRILKPFRSINWYHIAGMVLFGKDILFNEQLPPSISPWFHICDLRSVATRLSHLHSNAIRLTLFARLGK